LEGGINKMPTYDVPNNITTFTSLVQWSNGVIDGYLGLMLLIAAFVVSFGVSIFKTDAANSFCVAMIFVTFWAILFKIIGIISGVVLFVCIIFSALGLLLTSKDRRPY